MVSSKLRVRWFGNDEVTDDDITQKHANNANRHESLCNVEEEEVEIKHSLVNKEENNDKDREHSDINNHNNSVNDNEEHLNCGKSSHD